MIRLGFVTPLENRLNTHRVPAKQTGCRLPAASYPKRSRIMEVVVEKEREQDERAPAGTPEKEQDDIFAIKEVEIEELAIDGVCGVY